MKISKLGFPLALAVVLSAQFSAGAAPLTVASYTMNNGAADAFNYRDFTYLPCPANNCNTNNFILSGGTGKLTDGVSPTTSWNAEGNNTQWVGWATFINGGAPPITFFFANTITIDSVTVWVDNTIGAGGVYLPASVSV